MAGPLEATPWRPWVQLAAFSLVLFLITAATYSSLGVVLPMMVKDEGWNWTEAGLGFTLLGVFTGASSMIPAWLIRRSASPSPWSPAGRRWWRASSASGPPTASGSTGWAPASAASATR